MNRKELYYGKGIKTFDVVTVSPDNAPNLSIPYITSFEGTYFIKTFMPSYSSENGWHWIETFQIEKQQDDQEVLDLLEQGKFPRHQPYYSFDPKLSKEELEILSWELGIDWRPNESLPEDYYAE